MNKNQITEEIRKWEREVKRNISMQSKNHAVRHAYIKDFVVVNKTTGEIWDKKHFLMNTSIDWRDSDLEIKVEYTITETRHFNESLDSFKDRLIH